MKSNAERMLIAHNIHVTAELTKNKNSNYSTSTEMKDGGYETVISRSSNYSSESITITTSLKSNNRIFTSVCKS